MKLILIDADILLLLKLKKSSEITGLSIDSLACRAVESFLSSQGFNNHCDNSESSSINQR